MDVLELKFVLELLGFPDYRALIAKIKLNPQTKATERDGICRNLCDRAFVAYSTEVTKLTIAPPGKSLLRLNTGKLPITDLELKVLQACAESTIAATQTGIRATNRQEIVQGLVDRGLIKAETTQIKEVWLTQRGQEYLQSEYNPSGTAPVISLDMLSNYLRFLRKSLGVETTSATSKGDVVSTQEIFPSQELVQTPARKLSDAEILQTIRDLDVELGTENYLPIYHLRQKLQTSLGRDELDRALYRLQRNDQIELSSLQEAIAYTPEQLEAGIPQNVGGPLFFIIVI